MALENNVGNGNSGTRQLVLISGYYGFNNLGDDAILETIVDELKQRVRRDNIVVLSNNPAETERRFDVPAINRWQAGPLLKALPRTKLFISGGGGLFQDTVSVRSPVYYGTQIAMAKTFGAKVMVFAQGLGPLNTGLGKMLTRGAFAMCDAVTVRDEKSIEALSEWGINAQLTADPVWTLPASPLPQDLNSQMSQKNDNRLRVGLSLRIINHFSEKNIAPLVEATVKALPETAVLVPLVLQPDQDARILDVFTEEWRKTNRSVEVVDTSGLQRPSQWIELLGKLDMTIAMRLHCAIMSIVAKTPTVALAYDPKVSHVASQFELPTLNLTKEGAPEGGKEAWFSALETAVNNRNGIAARASEKAEIARNLACQNFAILDRILKN